MDGHNPQQPDSRPVSPISVDEFEEDYAPSIVAPSIRQDVDDDDDAENPFSDPIPDESSPVITSASDIIDSLDSSSHQQQQDSSNSQAAEPSDSSPPPDPRYSIRKTPRQPVNGLSIQQDYQLPDPLPHRSSSTSSFVTPQSPIDSESGPSHPYTLYPQGLGVSRTASLATTADLHTPSLRASPRPQRPAYPYSLYPQGTSDSDGTVSDASVPSFNVGFPGHAQPFHRRIGADGEEQDIIGLDGHTEQLPPYTRYPDAAITKGPNDFGSSLPVIGEAAQSVDNLLPTRRPTSDAMSTSTGTTSHAPAFGPSSSTEPLNPSGTNTHEPGLSEKSFRQKSWKERRHHRLCGCLPVWGLLLGIAVIVVIVVICGGVIGGYVVQLRDQYKKDLQRTHTTKPPPSTNTLVDAYPITTPTAVSLPTGIYEVPLSVPDTRFSACLPPNQANAWSCDLPPNQSLFFKLYGSPDKLFLDTIPAPNMTNVTYGTQPPEIRGQKLKLVIDVDDRTLGAAYHFQTFYDKLVIIPDSFLDTPPFSTATLQENFFASFSRRSAFLDKASFPYPPVQVGDYAWFCEFGDSFIEGNVFVKPIHPDPAPSYTTSSIPSTDTSPTPGSNVQYYQNSLAAYLPPTSTSTSSSIQTPATPYPTPNPYYDEDSETSEDDGATYHIFRPRAGAGVTPPSIASAVANGTSTTSTTTPSAPLMTNIVKLEERRVQGFGGNPICTRMTYQEDYKWTPAYDESQQLVTVLLKEDDGGNWMRKYRYKVGRRADDPSHTRKAYHGDVEDTCYCEWISFIPPSLASME